MPPTQPDEPGQKENIPVAARRQGIATSYGSRDLIRFQANLETDWRRGLLESWAKRRSEPRQRVLR